MRILRKLNVAPPEIIDQLEQNALEHARNYWRASSRKLKPAAGRNEKEASDESGRIYRTCAQDLESRRHGGGTGGNLERKRLTNCTPKIPGGLGGLAGSLGTCRPRHPG